MPTPLDTMAAGVVQDLIALGFALNAQADAPTMPPFHSDLTKVLAKHAHQIATRLDRAARTAAPELYQQD